MKQYNYQEQANLAIDKLTDAIRTLNPNYRIKLLHECRSRIQHIIRMHWRDQNEKRKVKRYRNSK